MNKRTLLTIAALVFVNVSLWATIRMVDNRAGSGANFSTVQAAVTAAIAGDTILIAGSSLDYTGTVTLNKRLTLIGPGYFLDENPNLNANQLPARISGAITFEAGSSGSEVIGITSVIATTINNNLTNITLRRNNFFQVNCGNNLSNIFIQQNYVGSVRIGAGGSNIFVRNNIFTSILVASGTSSVSISNNVFTGTSFTTISNSVFQNNVIAGTMTITFNSSTVQNNLASGTQLPAGNSNQNNVVMSSVFLPQTGNSTDGRWRLAAGSPAIGAGVGGVDCGVFGGTTPYILSGIPPLPTVYFFSAPTEAGISGLPVQVRIRANN
jgi:hypothetical protein